ncbi:MAG TPA: hypothetical protein PKC30_09430 [Saprospiraceae bacterium]|nr:hypothetical protein [Saprospiraceae bacterium]
MESEYVLALAKMLPIIPVEIVKLTDIGKSEHSFTFNSFGDVSGFTGPLPGLELTQDYILLS